MKCFIACAFGKEDVDKMYTLGILSVLKEKKYQPLRVDKVEHNSNIDKKIVELIEEADFLICDLTYARPSVYFEAGLAEGYAKPVIYLVRKDHFTPKPEDTFGNYKVHFDLQMRNIIDWYSTTQLETFKKRLGRRINHVCEPLLKKSSIEEAKKEEVEKFNLLSLAEKREQIREGIQLYFNKKLWTPYYWSGYEKEKKIVSYYVNKDIKIIINLSIVDNLTLSIINEGHKIRNRQRGDTLIKEGYEYHHFFISLRPIPPKRIEDAFPHSHTLGSRFCIFDEEVLHNHVCIHFISGYKIAADFIDNVISITQKIVEKAFSKLPYSSWHIIE